MNRWRFPSADMFWRWAKMNLKVMLQTLLTTPKSKKPISEDDQRQKGGDYYCLGFCEEPEPNRVYQARNWDADFA